MKNEIIDIKRLLIAACVMCAIAWGLNIYNFYQIKTDKDKQLRSKILAASKINEREELPVVELNYGDLQVVYSKRKDGSILVEEFSGPDKLSEQIINY